MKRKFPVALALIAGLMTSAQAEPSAKVVVGEKVLGPTPRIIGINTGEMPEGCAFPEWIRALGVNGARLRLNVAPAKKSDQKVRSFSELEQEAHRLRSSAKQETPQLWTHPSKLAASSLRALQEADIEMLATITCPFSYLLLQPDGKTNWSQAWRFWEAYYAQAYQLARQHRIRRFQLFNEPNHKESLKLTQEEYAARMAVGCDAIQAALADASRDGGAQLEPLISAPCTAGISVFTKTGKPDARDEKIGWGELSLRDRHLRMNGEYDAGYTQFQQYAVQHYSANPTTWLEQLEKLYGLIQKANRGQPLPVVMSEYNIHTARDFAKRPTTMDSPEEFSEIGSMAVAIAESGLEELYFFRLTLSKNFDDGGVKKNGIHHVNEGGFIPEITGTTRAAEVIRLAARALRGAQERLGTQILGEIRATATRSQQETHVLLARTNATTNPAVEISFPQPIGRSLLTWERVTESSFGSVLILNNSADQKDVRLELPGFSVGLLQVRTVSGTTPSSVASAAAFSTEAGKLQTGGTNRAQTIFQFPAVNGMAPMAVFLKLQGNLAGSQSVPIHLYRWVTTTNETILKSGQFPFRKKEMPDSDEPSLSLEGLGQELQWVGGFTVEPGTRETCVEITQAVARAKGSPLSLILTRERRQVGEKLEADPVEWQGANLMVYPR